MKILWINEKADFVGGCESYVAHTADLLAKEGIENILLYNVEGWTEPLFLKNFQKTFPLVEPCRQIQEINPDLIYIHRCTSKEFMKEVMKTQPPKVIFYHDHQLFCLREHKYKTLTHQTCTKPIGLRCYPCLGFVNKKKAFPKLKLRTHFSLRAQQKIQKKAQAFVVASQYMKDHLVEHGYSSKKIVVAPLYSAAIIDDAPRFPQNGQLLFVGQILRGKGVGVLLKALKLLPDEIRCTFCGSGHQLEKFQNLATKMSLGNRAKFLGKISTTELKKHYRKAEMVVVPSITPETFGLVGLEAMSFAKPIIASDVGGINMWLHHNKNGLLVSSNNASRLAAAIRKLHNEEKIRREMGEHGQAMLLKDFRPQHHLQKLKQLFEKLAAK